MVIILFSFSFILGVVVGSFLNVVILRHGTGVSLRGRSHCFSCGRMLRWHELFPLVSFLAQRGHCRTCRSRISWQYPAVEFATGLIFLVTIYSLLPTTLSALFTPAFFLTLVSLWVIFSLLVIIVVYDFRHKIILNAFVYPFIVLSLIPLFLPYPLPTIPRNLSSATYSLLTTHYSLLSGPVLFSFFAFLWLVSRGRWMGFGDAKLALGVGWLLGLSRGIAAVIFSFWTGAVVSVVLIVLARIHLSRAPGRLTMKSEVPFAPFLALGTLVAFFVPVDILRFFLPFL